MSSAGRSHAGLSFWFTRLDNATVEIPGSPARPVTTPSATPVLIPGNPLEFAITGVRPNPSLPPCTVRLVVTHGCVQ